MEVVIVDDNAMIRNLLEEYFELDEKIDVIATAEDGDKGLEVILKLCPDVVVLDVLMPKKDGIAVLEELKAKGMLDGDIRCIVLTAVNDEFLTKKLFELGADYIMLKPFNLEDLKKRICDIGEIEEPPVGINMDISILDNVEKKLTAVLRETGFTPNLKGYKYLKCSILIAYNDESTLDAITKFLYPRVAKENKTYYSQVERTMRSAIQIAWEKSDGRFFRQIFGNNISKAGKRPSNGEFIAGVVEYLK